MTLSAADRRRKLRRQFLLTSPPKGSPPMGKRKLSFPPPAKDLSPAKSTPASDASIVNPVSDLAAQLASSVPCSSTETLILKTVAPEFATPAAEPASTPVIKSATVKAPASIAQTSRSGTNGGDLPVTDKPEFALLNLISLWFLNLL
ncbi:BnaC07g16180D [Brassica napus]|uniref:BnaC07g16180D protein n=1 Tax=Brassica napus TaxID=3708 RepID=A0A078FEK8_BRANA|nr:BnaC07g16180D [Brassica napus]